MITSVAWTSRRNLMDFEIYQSWLTLFGTNSYSNVTWSLSMLLSFELAIKTIIFNVRGAEQSTEDSNVFGNVFHVFLLLFMTAISSRLYGSLSQWFKGHFKQRRQRTHKTALCDLPEYSLSELTGFNGSNEGGKIYVALNGKIFDVSKDRRHYNPGGSYKMLAGRDASRAFATLSFKADSLCTYYDDLSDIDDIQKNNLDEWESIFMQKYSIVGRIVRDHSPKRLQELSMKAISKQVELCRSNSHCRDFTNSLPLPTVLKRTLRNYFHEHME